jgi:hypothetical protein
VASCLIPQAAFAGTGDPIQHFGGERCTTSILADESVRR